MEIDENENPYSTQVFDFECFAEIEVCCQRCLIEVTFKSTFYAVNSCAFTKAFSSIKVENI